LITNPSTIKNKTKQNNKGTKINRKTTDQDTQRWSLVHNDEDFGRAQVTLCWFLQLFFFEHHKLLAPLSLINTLVLLRKESDPGFLRGRGSLVFDNKYIVPCSNL
jgi:hypothetical protein